MINNNNKNILPAITNLENLLNPKQTNLSSTSLRKITCVKV